MKISMTQFVAVRHFNNPSFPGTKIDGSPEDFIASVNKTFNQLNPSPELVAGYAPFCKHLFIENFTGALSGVVAITEDNHTLLRSEYVARREGELPVLSRYFRAEDVDVPTAPFLDVILYSAEQLKAEGNVEIDGDWGVVSINSAMTAEESPMTPITMMRNALGKDEGGSGVTLNREAYAKSVAYWSVWATVQ